MVPAKQGLIVNVSSSGGLTYLFNVAYGVGKAAVSRTSLNALENEKKKKLPGLCLLVLTKYFRWLHITTLKKVDAAPTLLGFSFSKGSLNNPLVGSFD